MENKSLFYSRQSAALGLDMQNKINNLKIIIVGIKAIGIEILKNLILSGVHTIYLYDQSIVQNDDKTYNFFHNEKDSNYLSRAEAAKINFSHLNKSVIIKVIEKIDFLEEIETKTDFNIIIINDNFDKEILIKINNYCRMNKKGFIYSGMLGCFGYFTIDFGKDFQVLDKNGKSEISLFIKEVQKKDKNIFILDFFSNDEDYILNKNSQIKIKNIKEFENKICRIVNIINKYSVEVEVEVEVESELKEFKNSTATILKLPHHISFQDFESSLINPKFYKLGIKKPDIEPNLHLILLSYFSFYEKYKRKPNKNDYISILQIAEEINFLNICNENNNDDIRLDFLSDFDKDILEYSLLYNDYDFPPLGTMIGAIISQEALKYTQKFIPNNKWFFYDVYDLLINAKKDWKNIKINSRRNLYEIFFDENIIEFIKSQNIFLVGCGALGCEYMKFFSSLGISENNIGSLNIADDDSIEYSNLNRQFLYKLEDLNKNKADILKKRCLEYSKNLNINSFSIKVCKNSDNIFDDDFFEKTDFIFGSVDNLEARNYLQMQSIFYEKVFFDTGTMGLESNFYQFIPFETCTLFDLPKPVTQQIPLCTIHNHPYKPQHMIEWAKIALFDKIFIDYINSFKKNIEINNNINELFIKDDLESKLHKHFLNLIKTKNVDSLIHLSIMIFQEFFIHKINDIINDLPENSVDTEGKPIWQGNKIFPSALQINFLQDKDQKDFLFFTSKIYAYIFNIAFNENWLEILEKINLNYLFKDQIEFEIQVEKFNLDIKELNKEMTYIKEVVYEKDDIIIGYNDFLSAAATLRSFNYKLNKISPDLAKIVAGKITPALSTTTSLIVSFGVLEFLKTLTSNHNNFSITNLSKNNKFCVKTSKNACFSLGNFSFNLFQMIPSKKLDFDNINMISYKDNLTLWDKLIINKVEMLDKLIYEIEKEYIGYNVFTINWEDICLYSSIVKELDKDYIKKKICDLIPNLNNIKKKYLKMNALVIGQNEEILMIPLIKIIL